MPTLEQRLQLARENKDDYIPNPEILKILGERVTAICVVVGPTGVGKSTLIEKVCERDNDFFLLGTVTTREGSERDPANYMTDVPVEDLLDLIEQGKVLQYDITEDGKIYASTLDSVEDGIMIVPVLSSGVSQFLQLVKDVVITAIVASGKEWDQYLEDRRGDSRYRERMNEALISLQYVKDRIDHISVLENQNGTIDKLADQLIAIMKQQELRNFRGDSRRLHRKIDEMQQIAYRDLETIS